VRWPLVMALSASVVPDVHEESKECDDANPKAPPPSRSFFLRGSRLISVVTIMGHYMIYHYGLLTPLQSLEGLTLLAGSTTLRLTSWIRCCISIHLATWLLLQLPLLLLGLQLTERLRARFPPWAVFRLISCTMGLNDLVLAACLYVYIDLTTVGGGSPLEPMASQQLYLLHSHSCSLAFVHLINATALTPNTRLRLASWREAFMAYIWSHIESSRSAMIEAAELYGDAVAKIGLPSEPAQPMGETAPNGKECIVCMQALKATPGLLRRSTQEASTAECILAPWGHAGFCQSCASDLAKSNAPCPLCRQPIESLVKQVYFTTAGDT